MRAFCDVHTKDVLRKRDFFTTTILGDGGLRNYPPVCIGLVELIRKRSYIILLPSAYRMHAIFKEKVEVCLRLNLK